MLDGFFGVVEAAVIDIVDERDCVIGQADRAEIYARGLRNRIVTVVVIDPVTREFGVQKRAANLAWQAGHYAWTVCGHVEAGEAWEQAAQRELREEAGLDRRAHFVAKRPFTCSLTGHPFMLATYVCEAALAPLAGDPREVAEIYRMMYDDVEALIAHEPKLHNLFEPTWEDLRHFVPRPDAPR